MFVTVIILKRVYFIEIQNPFFLITFSTFAPFQFLYLWSHDFLWVEGQTKWTMV